MTKVAKRRFKCAKCGTESEQIIFYSVNFSLGIKEHNEDSMKHQQVCPKCNYTNFDISVSSNVEEKNINSRNFKN